MADGDPPSFRTKREPVTSNAELRWGGSDGKAWSDAIDTSSGITVTNNGSVQTETDIPDSEELHAHYDATALLLSNGDSVSTWRDETGNGHDLTAGTSPTYRSSGINGNPVIEFDDADYLDVAFSALSQPNHIFIVYEYRAVNTATPESIIDSQQNTAHRATHGTDGDYSIFAGSPSLVSLTDVDTSPHIRSPLFDGTNSQIRVDGTTLATGETGTGSLDGLTVGQNLSGGEQSSINVGEILVYPIDKTSVQSDVEQYLNDKWAVF